LPFSRSEHVSLTRTVVGSSECLDFGAANYIDNFTGVPIGVVQVPAVKHIVYCLV
jgi:hypothetical protein